MKIFASLDDPEVLRLLNQGAIGVIPTDTIYGLAAQASNVRTVGRLYGLKGRESKPGTVVAADIDQLTNLGVDSDDLYAVKHHWPNPISIVIDAGAQAGYMHQQVGSLAVRIPNDDVLQRFLQKTGPLVTTSANQPGEPPAGNLVDAQKYFGDQVDFYVEGGDRSDRPPSTVARFTDGKLTVLRQGAVTIDEVNGSAGNDF